MSRKQRTNWKARDRARIEGPAAAPEGDPMLPVQVLTASPELLETCLMAQKAKAFDVLMGLREALADVKRAKHTMAKKIGSRSDSLVLSQFSGREMQIERDIDAIFQSFKEVR